eukprot:7218096-Alexandrium_andersonii.AAC.1
MGLAAGWAWLWVRVRRWVLRTIGGWVVVSTAEQCLKVFPPGLVQNGSNDGILEAWLDVPSVVRHGSDGVRPTP